VKDAFSNMVPPAAKHLADLSPTQAAKMPFIAKVPGLTVDVEKLNWHLQNVVKTFPITHIQRDPTNPLLKYGGWSVTSFTGAVQDGWQSQLGWRDGKFDSLLAYKNNWRPRWFYRNKTAICTGYLNEVVDMVADMGFNPTAIRIWDNPPGGCHIGRHTDGPDNQYSVRLHIPIVTNDDCVHVWYTDPETRVHIPADGSSYLFRTNVNHDTFNNGTTERFHLIFEVWDTVGVVPEFKYTRPADFVEQQARAWVAQQERALAKETA
jgi:hypothetical protein